MSPNPLPASGAVDVVVVGAGAAGIAAARRLAAAGLSLAVVEARDRIGGRAWTVADRGPYPLDLGCGWLHSADRNPLVAVAGELGLAIDRTLPPWGKRSTGLAFAPGEQERWRADLEAFYARLHAAADSAERDRPAADLLEPGNRWNPLMHAVSTYVNGVELDRLSLRDYARYDDSGVNWRVPQGYGTLIAAAGAGLPVRLGCAATRIDHSGRRLAVETTLGTLTADAVVVTVPTSLLAAGAIDFRPALPDKRHAAAVLPLGLADKLLLAVERPDDLPAQNTHSYGRIDTAATAAYHFRPFGRPLIEGYFGGRLARALEAGGEAAFLAHAADELAGLLGNDIRRRIRPVVATGWDRDPWARGSYSHALPGHADARAELAAPVDGRILFAGEACSPHDFSTAHGAWQTGVAAADAIVAARG
ncbi:MAG: FAD-dependent oxidoreductase [Alphaproteobacteria bacterium]|nr:FAD-dependent oxidoreductase [Alphaproteobacteria bacterium]